MAEKRMRMRIPFSARGEGEIVETGQTFTFEIKDFSSAGVQCFLLEGQTPGLGESIRLTFEMETEEAQYPLVGVKGTVRRIESVDGQLLCGIRVDGIFDSDNGDALDQIYIEKYFDLFG